ncbi:acetyltransferase [Shewanella algae]|uniref:acetyltransferase n=1 Tax=Shewanella algae TaxID=38313 RepID=UPI000697C613|nr:acetyltransferase [Shewanella algae]MCE9781760.1 acetyltransferase [Shewanella algae]MCE9828566.1 acetyltransferase [Shewanella algae]
MSNPIIIFGASGLAAEVYSWILDVNDISERFLCFCVSDEYYVPDAKFYGHEVKSVSMLDDIAKFDFILAFGGEGDARASIVEMLKGKGGNAISFIHPSVVLSPFSLIGEGVIINPNCSISPGVVIGDFSLINCNCAIGHDAKIGNYTSLLGSNTINGHVEIGERVLIGSGATIHPKVKVADDATVGMGSVVFTKVRAKTTVLGNPAKKM